MRYMIESKRVGSMDAPQYDPIGVWVHDGDELLIRHTEGHRAEERDAAALLVHLPDELPPDILEYWRDAMPAHRGMRSDPVSADEYGTMDACAEAMLEQIQGVE